MVMMVIMVIPKATHTKMSFHCYFVCSDKLGLRAGNIAIIAIITMLRPSSSIPLPRMLPLQMSEGCPILQQIRILQTTMAIITILEWFIVYKIIGVGM